MSALLRGYDTRRTSAASWPEFAVQLTLGELGLGPALAGLFGAAATASLARPIIDARDIIREHRGRKPP